MAGPRGVVGEGGPPPRARWSHASKAHSPSAWLQPIGSDRPDGATPRTRTVFSLVIYPHGMGRAVSVVIRTYERPDYLPGAVETALQQTHNPLRVVVVDDGSSTEYAAELAASYDRVRCIEHGANRGSAAAMNTGLDTVDGEFVAFLDDDRWHETKVERQVAALATTPEAGLATCLRISVTPEGQVVSCQSSAPSGDLSRRLLVRNAIGSPSRVLTRREVVTEHRFDETLPTKNDWEFPPAGLPEVARRAGPRTAVHPDHPPEPLERPACGETRHPGRHPETRGDDPGSGLLGGDDGSLPHGPRAEVHRGPGARRGTPPPPEGGFPAADHQTPRAPCVHGSPLGRLLDRAPGEARRRDPSAPAAGGGRPVAVGARTVADSGVTRAALRTTAGPVNWVGITGPSLPGTRTECGHHRSP
jgi:hypothetical protein